MRQEVTQMITVNITYNVEILESDGSTIIGEACTDVEMLDEYAELLLNEIRDGAVMHSVEQLLTHQEMLKGRTYVAGSIKYFDVK